MSVVEQIATALTETEKTSYQAIERLVKVVGEERALALLQETLILEANGGLSTDDSSRRRTAGGTFFKLAKNQLSSRERWWVFKTTTPQAQSKGQLPSPGWEELQPLVSDLLVSATGEATTAKMTLVGKPGRVVEKGEVVLTSIQSGKAPSLPKGLPIPPPEPTTYLLFIAIKQWKKVRETLRQNSEDVLIVEGYPVFDRRLGQSGAMTLYAQSVTTKLIEQNKREQQRNYG